jgi:hypothetical protein
MNTIKLCCSGRHLGHHHLKLPGLCTAQDCPVEMLERHHHPSLLLRKDSDRRVGKMPVCEAHQDHNKPNSVKGRPSRQLGPRKPSKRNKDGPVIRRLCRDRNQARNE